ncbi:MAG: hypothetical protein V9G29_12700 [Burkholderiaceae bacterium]|jgi:hypothetical protein
MNTPVRIVALAALLIGLSACGESPQGERATGAADRPAWDTVQNGYTAPGYPRGDRMAWERQLSTRAQNQNEYSRQP